MFIVILHASSLCILLVICIPNLRIYDISISQPLPKASGILMIEALSWEKEESVMEEWVMEVMDLEVFTAGTDFCRVIFYTTDVFCEIG